MKPQEPSQNSTDLKTLKHLWRFLWPKDDATLRHRVVISSALLIFSKIISVLIPIFYKKAIDVLTHPSDLWYYTPLFMVLGYGIVRIFSQFFNELKDIVFAKVAQRAIRRSALSTFNRLHELSLRFHLDRKTGAISRVIERGVRAIDTVLRFSMFNIFPTIFEIAFVCIILFYMYDYEYSLLTIVTLTTYIAFTIGITTWRTKYVRKVNAIDNISNTKAIDSLINYETVKYFNNELHEERRYDESLAKFEKISVKNRVSLALLNIGQGVIIAVGLTAIMIFAANDVQVHKMTVGDFVLVNTYLLQLYLPLNVLGFAYREIKLAIIDMEGMYEILSELPEITNKSGAKDLVITKAELEFSDVHFSYNPNREIIHGLNFIIPSGETVAIVGPSGAGKSTISRLLFRFYDVTSGAIKIDGQDIREVTQSSLRQAIGVVPQDTVLFNDTIFYNILYGNPFANSDEVVEAAKLAKIHDFVLSLPDGYETMVGERGLKLSGGEKQRVAIARTILKKPSIFLFDEATSALDTHTEKEIQKSLREVSKNHTTIIIAHRLSTVIDADEILVLENGRITERGSHKELLAMKGQYATMWKKQLSKTEVSKTIV